MMHEIIWSNGKIDRARTWQRMLDQIRADQWADLDEEEFRAVMCKRAYRWSNALVDMGATPAEFFRELERAKLIVIVRPGDKEEDTPPRRMDYDEARFDAGRY